MTLNPNWNQYNVAPVGPNIIVGHKRALQGGITRDSAINLIAWLIIATEAQPEEIGAEIQKAQTGNPADLHPTTLPGQRRQQVQPPAQAPALNYQQPNPQAMAGQGNQRPSPTLRGTTGRGPTAPVAAVAPRAPGQPLAGPTTMIQRPSPRLHPGGVKPGTKPHVARTAAPTPAAPATVAPKAPTVPVVASEPEPEPEAPPATPDQLAGLPQDVVDAAAPFLADLDAEEAEALAEGVADLPPDHPVHQTAPVDVDSLAAKWNGSGQAKA